MLLFVAAIQAIPGEINEASMVDGASYWQRVWRITLPLTLRTVLLGDADQRHRFVLAFDQFYIMTAGQPQNRTATPVFFIYLNSFPYLKRLWRSAVADPRGHRPRLHHHPDDPQPAEPRMSAIADMETVYGARPSLLARLWENRTTYLIGALLIAISTIMLLPLLASVSASFKVTSEASSVPPTLIPRTFSIDSYIALWNYQEGLAIYLANSFGTAILSIVFTLALTIPAGYALARFPIPGKEILFVFLLLALIIPYQALLTPIFLMFAALKLTNSIVGLAIIHTAIQLPFSLYIMRNSFESVPRELEEAAVIDGCTTFQVLWRICLPSVVPAMITVALFAFIMSWNEFLGALVMMSKESAYTLPVILATSRTETAIGGTDWGLLQAGVTISIIPCVAIYLLLQKYYVSGLLSGAVK